MAFTKFHAPDKTQTLWSNIWQSLKACQQGKRIPQLFRQKSTNTDNNTPSKETADLKFKVNFFTLDL